MRENKSLKLFLVLTSILIIGLPFIIADLIPNDVSNIVKPLSWIFFALIIYFILPKQRKKFDFKRSDVRQFALIGSLIFIILFFSSGLVIGYSNSPFNRTFLGFVRNFWFLGVVVIFQEFVRATFIKQASKKDLKFVFIYLTLFFVLVDLNIQVDILRIDTADALFNFIVTDFITILITSAFVTYLSYRDGTTSALLYRLPITIAFMLSPIFPANVFIVLFLIETVVPFLMFLKIEKLYEKNNVFLRAEQAGVAFVLGRIAFFGILVVLVGFSIGAFRVSPIVIATNSMYPAIERGDIVIRDELDIEKAKIGDVIVYDLNGASIIHRIIQINKTSEGTFFVTKGDNNASPDALYVEESQIHGKIVTTIPKAGYPTLWLRQLLNNPQSDVNVEMGEINEWFR